MSSSVTINKIVVTIKVSGYDNNDFIGCCFASLFNLFVSSDVYFYIVFVCLSVSLCVDLRVYMQLFTYLLGCLFMLLFIRLVAKFLYLSGCLILILFIFSLRISCLRVRR